jgi:hypothetical protein
LQVRTTTIVHFFVDIAATVSFSVDFVSHILSTIEVVVVFSLLVHVIAILLNDWFFESKLVLNRDVRQFEQYQAHTFSVACFDFARRQIAFDTKLLKFEKNILTGCLGIVIFVPFGLMVVQR